MDRSSVIGITAGTALLLLGYVLEGGTPTALLQLSAAVIVFGGTFGAVVASFPMSELKKFPKWLKIAFTEKSFGTQEAYNILIHFSEKARREGLLSLEQDLETIEDRFTRQGMQLVIDGTDPEITREILESNITVMERRHKVGIHVFEAAGGYAPTMGIIGTVMGLVMVLGNLSDPEALAHSIAAAFIATLYGVSSANVLWLPIASKLKQRDRAEVAAMEMILDGIISIQAGENPSILKEKLKTHLGDIPVSKEKKQPELGLSEKAAFGESR